MRIISCLVFLCISIYQKRNRLEKEPSKIVLERRLVDGQPTVKAKKRGRTKEEKDEKVKNDKLKTVDKLGMTST